MGEIVVDETCKQPSRSRLQEHKVQLRLQGHNAARFAALVIHRFVQERRSLRHAAQERDERIAFGYLQEFPQCNGFNLSIDIAYLKNFVKPLYIIYILYNT